MSSLPKIKLLASKILVKQLPRKEKTESGILMPVNAKLLLEDAEVILLADNIKYLKPGDKIQYPAGAGVIQEYDGVNYKFLNGPTETSEGDIWVILS